MGTICRGDKAPLFFNGRNLYELSSNIMSCLSSPLYPFTPDVKDVDSAAAGDVVAMFGVDCSSMDTFTDGRCACKKQFPENGTNEHRILCVSVERRCRSGL